MRKTMRRSGETSGETNAGGCARPAGCAATRPAAGAMAIIAAKSSLQLAIDLIVDAPPSPAGGRRLVQCRRYRESPSTAGVVGRGGAPLDRTKQMGWMDRIANRAITVGSLAGRAPE